MKLKVQEVVTQPSFSKRIMEFGPVNEIELIFPDDFHHHLRDGEVLENVVEHASRSFQRVLAMPNIKPPVRTLEDAIAYKQRISSFISEDATTNGFQLLMTLYLTDNTSPSEITEAKESGIVYACKLYPAGATTNSEFGVTSIESIKPALQVILFMNLHQLFVYCRLPWVPPRRA